MDDDAAYDTTAAASITKSVSVSYSANGTTISTPIPKYK
jgi:hypothetical protein